MVPVIYSFGYKLLGTNWNVKIKMLNQGGEVWDLSSLTPLGLFPIKKIMFTRMWSEVLWQSWIWFAM